MKTARIAGTFLNDAHHSVPRNGMRDGPRSAIMEQSAAEPLRQVAKRKVQRSMHAESVRRSENWTRENLAWMAGIFEGEGYVQGRKRSYKRKDGRTFSTVGYRITVSMTDEDIIRRFYKLAGLGNFNGPRLSPSMAAKGRKPIYDYTASGVDAYALVMAMWMWLGIRRRDQIKTATTAWLQSSGHWRRKIATSLTD